MKSQNRYFGTYALCALRYRYYINVGVRSAYIFLGKGYWCIRPIKVKGICFWRTAGLLADAAERTYSEKGWCAPYAQKLTAIRGMRGRGKVLVGQSYTRVIR
ncbi:unnamed protein product, partial [Nesidiocoris tenuis]